MCFSKTLFDDLFCGEAYIQGGKFALQNKLGQLIVGRQMKNDIYRAVFACFILYLRAISMYKLLGACIQRGNLTEEFHVTSLAGLYLEEIYLIVVNCNQTEPENERVENCARVA